MSSRSFSVSRAIHPSRLLFRPAQLRPPTHRSRRVISSLSSSSSDPCSSSQSSLARIPRGVSYPRTTFVRTFTSTSRRSAGNGDAPSSDIPVKQMTPSEYERVSEIDMEILHENLEVLCEEFMPDSWEVEYGSGVMSIHAPPHGTYVINKQPPNQQIWMSSPISGPARFGYSPEGIWVHHRRKGISLGELLDSELRQIGGESAEGWQGVGLR